MSLPEVPQDWQAPLIALAREAGAAILEVYQTDFAVQAKDDRSPLTAADLAAHRVIARGLAQIAPHIPLLSEEGAGIGWDTRRAWSRYWLVDPLDGTREFVKRNGEFTVNIALVEDGVPVLAWSTRRCSITWCTRAAAPDAGCARPEPTGTRRSAAAGRRRRRCAWPRAARIWIRAPRGCSKPSVNTSASGWAPRSSSAASPKAAPTSIRASGRPRRGLRRCGRT